MERACFRKSLSSSQHSTIGKDAKNGRFYSHLKCSGELGFSIPRVSSGGAPFIGTPSSHRAVLTAVMFSIQLIELRRYTLQFIF